MPRPAPAADFLALLVGLLGLIEAHRATATSAAAVALLTALSRLAGLARVYATGPGWWTLRTTTDAPEFSGGACTLSLDRPADWHEHPAVPPAVLALRLAMFAVDTRRALGLPLRRARPRRPRLVLLQGGRTAGPRPAAE